MKKIAILPLLLFAMSFSAFAEMGSRMSSPGASQMSESQTTHMMTRDMVQDMSRIMQQMTTMTRDMDRLMQKDMDQVHMRDMAKVMEQLSQAMGNMSQSMAKGEFNKNMVQEMEKHMNQIRSMIKNMQ